MPEHNVQQGECLSSIAAGYGLRWQTIWNHPNNAALKSKRKDPNILFPGDVLFIPPKAAKLEAKGTDAAHAFVVEIETTYIRLQVLDWDKPRADAEYDLEVDGRSYPGRTDPSGYLEEEIPAAAESARLFLGPLREQVEISIGTLDPISEVTGRQARLNNLGYPCPVNGTMDDRTEDAIRLFQTDANLAVTGAFDGDTISKIRQQHGR